jgi:hypothetical protein
MDLLLAPDSREPLPPPYVFGSCRSYGEMVTIFSLKFRAEHSTPSYNSPKFGLGTAAASLVPRASEARGKSAPVFARSSTAQTATAIATPQLTHMAYTWKSCLLYLLALFCTLAALDEGQREAHAQGPSIPQAGQVVLL